MCGVETIAIPHHTYADVGERWVNDVRVVARRCNKGGVDVSDSRPGSDVFTQLCPAVGYPSAEGAGMADVVALAADAVAHLHSPASGDAG